MTAKTYMQSGRVGACIVRIGYGKVIEPKNPKLLKQHQQQGSTTAPEKQESTSSSNISSQPTKSLWVGNLPYATTPASLEAMFATYGTVESARILTHKNCGFVNFTNAAHAAAAKLAMNGKRAPGSGAADAGVAGVLKIGFAKVPTKADLVSVNRATACMREKNTYYPGKQQQVQHQQSSTTVYPRLIAGAPIIPVFPPTSSVQFDNSSPDRHQYDYDQQYSVPTFAMSTIETALPSPPPPPPPVAAAEHYPALSEVYKSSSSSLTETTTISVSSDRAALRIDTSPITTGTATTATRRSVSSSSALSCDSSSTAVVPYIATTMSSVVDENEDGRVTGDEGGGSACSVDQEDEGKMHGKGF